MRRRTGPLLLALLAVLLVLPAAAQAVPRSGFGLQIADPLGAEGGRFTRDLALAQRLGAKVVRFQISWGDIEPERGRLDRDRLARADRAVLAAQAKGLRVLMLFQGTPCWASSAPAGEDCSRFPPRNAQDAVRAAALLARRYQNQLAAFQIWNEPDHRNELYFAGPDKINRYVALTKALYPALKSAAPRVPVLAGGFVGTDGRWLQALYAAGMKGSYDALSVHFYDLTLYALRTTRAIMRRNGDRKPMWLGETGWTSCRSRARSQLGHLCVSRGAQARFSVDLVRMLRRTSWVRGAIFFTARDTPQFDFGMLDRRGRQKPIVRLLRRELRSRRVRAVRRIRLGIRRTSRGLVLRGTGPAADIYRVEVRKGGRLRYRAFFRLDGNGRFRVALPASLGTRGLRVQVRHEWLKRSVSRSA